MTITIGSATLDNVFYDAEVDVLYRHLGAAICRPLERGYLLLDRHY